MFVIDIEYKVNLDLVTPWMEEHFEFINRYYSSGLFVVSGKKVPRTGGIIIVKNEDREFVHKLIKEDPFYRENLAHYTITEFLPSTTGDGFESLL